MSFTTFVVLLRGIMPTGKNKVPMADLRIALEKAGLRNVRTYIQSGNVLVEADLDQTKLEDLVHQVIKKGIGADIVVVARTASQFQKIVTNNPFDTKETEKQYFTLLADAPERSVFGQFAKADYSPEKVVVIKDTIYTLYATKYSDSKFNNSFIERKLKVPATTRNFNTMTKLVELAK